MRAAVYERYGSPDVVELRQIEKPTPKDVEVLIKIHATTVNSADSRVRSLNVPRGFGLLARLALGVWKPRQAILGSELAGTVEAVGKNVRRFKVGDAVVGYGGANMGFHAEYRCMRENEALEPMPTNLTFQQAAALSFGGTTALHFLRKGNVSRGDKVLVHGASGAVGLACVQLARHFGAEVTGVCSTENVELVRSLGAHQVIDYTREDFTKNGQTYDVIVDTVGSAPFSRSARSLAERGRLLMVCATLGDNLSSLWISLRGRKKVIAGVSLGTPAELREIVALARTGEFKPVIDRPYPFEQIVEAHRYVDGGHKKGSVVITFVSQ
jgi:NADPH:quinone reductase-like Zn-dependent oxidoreductase